MFNAWDFFPFFFFFFFDGGLFVFVNMSFFCLKKQHFVFVFCWYYSVLKGMSLSID